MAEITTLREAYNNVEIVGTLEEKNLERKVDEKGNEFIVGTLVVKYDENQKVKVSYRANKFKKDTTEISKIYTGLETVIEQYVSRAEALVKGLSEEEISYVRIRGKFGCYNTTKKQTGEPVTYNNITANFVERVERTEEPHAQFTAEIYFENIEKEIKEGEETGRVKIEGIMPIFGGKVMPIKFFTGLTDEGREVGDYILNKYSVGKTGTLSGNIESTVTVSQSNNGGVGKIRNFVYENIRTEYVVDWCPNEQYLITDPKHYDKATIKAACIAREQYLTKFDTREAPAVNNSNTVAYDVNTIEF